MEQNLFEWLKNDIEKVDRKVDQMDAKIDEILSFKWQVVGGSVVMSAIIGICIQIFLAFKP